MSLGSGRCNYHPDRAGIGICVECRSVICVECTTQFEGINRCATCLQKRLDAAQKLQQRSDWSAGSVMLSLIAASLLFGCFYFIAKTLS